MYSWCYLCASAAVQCSGGHRGDREVPTAEGTTEKEVHHHSTQQNCLPNHPTWQREEGHRSGKVSLLACVHIRGGVHNESTGQHGKDLQFPKLKTCNHGVICCFPSEANVMGLAVLCTNVHDIRVMCYVYILYVEVEYICTCILTVNYVLWDGLCSCWRGFRQASALVCCDLWDLRALLCRQHFNLIV